MTAMELLVGVDKTAAHPPDEEEALKIEGYFIALPIEQYTLDVARVHALLYNRVHKIGQPRSAHDLIIAATAAATGRTLRTADAAARFNDLPGVNAELVSVH